MYNFTISAKGRKGYNFETLGYTYQLDISTYPKTTTFYIYADNRQAAIAQAKVIISADYDNWEKEVSNQTHIQQLHVAEQYLLNGHPKYDVNYIIDYIKKIESTFNLVSSVLGKFLTDNSPKKDNEIEEETKNETETTYTAYNRTFSTYEAAYNYCIQSDFDPDYIQVGAASEASAIHFKPLHKLDLQLFASSKRKVYESNYSAVDIVTTNGLIHARIHPSELHDNKHKICYSSDDYFYIDDNEIISVSKHVHVMITKEGVWHGGIGKGLRLQYTISTTKHDDDIKNDFSNISECKCNSINQTIKTFNLYQKMGYKNIQIATTVLHKGKEIIEDISDCCLELDVNSATMENIKKENKELLNQAEKIERYEQFIKKYNAEKMFKEFIESGV